VKPEVSARHKALLDELDKVSEQQCEILERAAYLTMTDEDAIEFLERAARMAEISRLLGVRDSRYGAV
jgi:hypothetical protein